MHFILAPNRIKKLNTLRVDYETEKKIDLRQKPSMIGTPKFFGGVDVDSRKKQIKFLEKVRFIVNLHLLNEAEIKTSQQQMVNLIAIRFMIAACLYVQEQIGSSKRNSVLFRTIEDDLGITPENFVDEEDKETCFMTAKRLINTPNAFEHSNAALNKAGLKGFSENEWSKFALFLDEKCGKKESKSPHTNFPIISITQPLFGAVFKSVGLTLGFVASEAINNSTAAVSPRAQLTALIGTTLFFINPGTTGVALIAPVIATRLFNSFCTISLARSMEVAMGIVGQGVGIGVGLPFDVAYNLLYSICSIISHYSTKTPQLARIDGTRIVDGALIMAGVEIRALSADEIKALPANELLGGYIKKTLEITENGEIRIEGEKVDAADTQMQIPPDVLEELKKQLASRAKAQERSELSQKEDLDETEVVTGEFCP